MLATIDAHGVLAGREMARALGMPTIPDELCDPVDVLEARAAEGDERIRDVAAQLGIEDVDRVLAPFGRVDH